MRRAEGHLLSLPGAPATEPSPTGKVAGVQFDSRLGRQALHLPAVSLSLLMLRPAVPLSDLQNCASVLDPRGWGTRRRDLQFGAQTSLSPAGHFRIWLFGATLLTSVGSELLVSKMALSANHEGTKVANL